MDVQEDTPQTSSASEQATEPDNPGQSDQGEYPDQIPGGRYHIVDRLSTSALGAVYKALDTVLDRSVAVKCVRLDTPLSEQSPDELRERFVREARVVARLQHPNIVTIHDIVVTPNRGYIIMEFIEGRTLESLIASEGRLPLSTAIKVLSQLSSALDYAHGRKVVHRDVKPANILVSPDMYVWVTDFGIAKSDLSTNLTMAGGVLGTPDYMSPEQAKGEDVDARSDLFSLGCILFEAVVGEKPFRSPSLTGVLLSIINDEPVFPLNWRTLGLPTELKPILHHSLEKERDKRYPSGSELMVALDSIAKEAVDKADIAAGASPAAERAATSDHATTETESETADSKQELDARGSSPSNDVAQAKEESTNDEMSGGVEPEQDRSGDATADEALSAETDASKARAEDSADDEAEAEAKAVQEVEAKAAQEAEAKAAQEAEAKAEEEAKAKAEEEPEAEKASSEESDKAAISAEEIQTLKDESQVLHLSPTLSGDLQDVEISPEEGFLLSRIDGASRPNDIISVSPMAEADTARALMDLLGKGLIKLGGVTREPVAPAPEPLPPPPKLKRPEGPDAAVVAELDRLLALSKAQDYPALLGLPLDAPERQRKSAYLKIVAKFHPDKFPTADDGFREKLSTLCASASDAVSEFEKCVAARKEQENKGKSPINGRSGGPDGGAAAFDKRRHARELYDRAVSAYDRADYWDAIQLGRQAVEVDEQVAEFYGLLGRALLQNKKWRKEAADNFLKATKLDPNNVEFIGVLGAIYQDEGLTTRANSLLERARAIDPDYEFPDLDGPEVTID